jgi:hypothetical protein
MNHDESDELWELLGRARPVRPSPFFSRNVLRAIREDAPEVEPGFFEWLCRGWNALAAATAVAVVLFFALRTGGPVPAGTKLAVGDAAIEQVLASDEFAVIANLETLLSVDDNEIWLTPLHP